jgi:hypothetical protein
MLLSPCGIARLVLSEAEGSRNARRIWQSALGIIKGAAVLRPFLRLPLQLQLAREGESEHTG